jgi:hypothetical protein
MSYKFIVPNDTADFRQGDLLKKNAVDGQADPEWFFLLTADCDIAQRKGGERFTCLQIITAHDFMQRVWAPTAALKPCEKIIRALCETLNGKLKKLNSDWKLTESSLKTWISDSTAEEVYGMLQTAGVPADEKTLTNLRVCELLVSTQNHPRPLGQLLHAWRKQGVDEKSIRARLAEALAGSDGFSDYFLLPDLPGESGAGFVVLLRDIRTIEAKATFVAELDSRIEGHTNGYFRIGKTVDLIRFCIVQKFAFVFSRIGLPKQFESLIDVTTETIADDLAAKDYNA